MDNFRDYVDDPRLVLQHLPPPLQTAANYAPHLVRWLINYLISPVVYHFQHLGTQLTRLVHTSPSELQAQDIAFPLLSLILIYFAINSALRTARYAFSLSFWLVKWGTIIGIVAVAWAWYSGDPNAVASGRGRSTAPSLVDQAWSFVNGKQQREWLVDDADFIDWSSWVPDWIRGTGRANYWLEVVEGLGAENVKRAAEEWWAAQVDGKPKGNGKAKTSSKRAAKKQKEGKTSRVR